jgi:hypothetical protein
MAVSVSTPFMSGISRSSSMKVNFSLAMAARASDPLPHSVTLHPKLCVNIRLMTNRVVGSSSHTSTCMRH